MTPSLTRPLTRREKVVAVLMLSETVPVLVAKRVEVASAYQRRCAARSEPWMRALWCFTQARVWVSRISFYGKNYKLS
jgi:hypothetical protein